jgi:hypothetical protein
MIPKAFSAIAVFLYIKRIFPASWEQAGPAAASQEYRRAPQVSGVTGTRVAARLRPAN